MNEPSRGLRLSATTILKNGRLRAPARDMRILRAIVSSSSLVVSWFRRSAPEQSAHPGAHHPLLAEPRDLLHHATHLHELLHQPVDLLDRGPRAGGDAPAAAAVEELDVAALGPGHRAD